MIDIGANLCAAAFAADLPEVLGRARAAGLEAIIVTATTLDNAPRAAALCDAHPGWLWCTAGVHPHHADAAAVRPGLAGEIARLAAHPACVAVGECGLDWHRNLATRAAQLRVLEIHLEVAVALGKPLFLHCRDAHDDLLAALDRHAGRLPPCVVHCFTGGAAQVRACLERGFHVGVTGWIADARRAAPLREALPLVPAERLMVETDAPYLMPANRPGSRLRDRNEPAFLPWVIEAAAHHAGRDAGELARSSTAVARAFFRLPVPA